MYLTDMKTNLKELFYKVKFTWGKLSFDDLAIISEWIDHAESSAVFQKLTKSVSTNQYFNSKKSDIIQNSLKSISPRASKQQKSAPSTRFSPLLIARKLVLIQAKYLTENQILYPFSRTSLKLWKMLDKFLITLSLEWHQQVECSPRTNVVLCLKPSIWK